MMPSILLCIFILVLILTGIIFIDISPIASIAAISIGSFVGVLLGAIEQRISRKHGR